MDLTALVLVTLPQAHMSKAGRIDLTALLVQQGFDEGDGAAAMADMISIPLEG